MIMDGRDFIVGAYRKEIFLKLLALADIDRMDVIFHAQFFKQNRNFAPVRGCPCVKIDHFSGLVGF